MFTYVRTLWQNPREPVTGPAIDWSKIDTVVVHYPGMLDSPEGDDVTRYGAWLRNLQRSYLSNRGYSLGYSCAVSTVGESWEIRGTDIRPAATKGHNEHTFAILISVDGDLPASDAAVNEVRRLVARAEQLAGRSLLIRGHGEFGATSCPGAGVRAQIAANAFYPLPVPPDPPEPPMTTSAATLWRHSAYNNVFLIGAGSTVNVSPLVYESLVHRGVPSIVEAHEQLLKSCMFQTGLTDADLVPSRQP